MYLLLIFVEIVLILVLFQISCFIIAILSCQKVNFFSSSDTKKNTRKVSSLLLSFCKFLLLAIKEWVFLYLKKQVINWKNFLEPKNFFQLMLFPVGFLFFGFFESKPVAFCAGYMPFKNHHISDFLDVGEKEITFKNCLEVALTSWEDDLGEGAALNNLEGHIIRFENSAKSKIFDFWLDTAMIKSSVDPNVIDSESDIWGGARYIDVTGDKVDWEGLVTQPRTETKQRFYFVDENEWKFSKIDLIQADGLVQARPEFNLKKAWRI